MMPCAQGPTEPDPRQSALTSTACDKNPVVPANKKSHYGDNWMFFVGYVRDESVDLVYLDPPFNSRQDYNVLFAEKDGTRSASQIMAFEDTWEWNQESAQAIRDSSSRAAVAWQK